MSNNITDVSADKHPVANKFIIYLGSFLMVSSLIALLVFSLLDKFRLDKFSLHWLGNSLLGAGFLLMGLKNRRRKEAGRENC